MVGVLSQRGGGEDVRDPAASAVERKNLLLVTNFPESLRKLRGLETRSLKPLAVSACIHLQVNAWSCANTHLTNLTALTPKPVQRIESKSAWGSSLNLRGPTSL